MQLFAEGHGRAVAGAPYMYRAVFLAFFSILLALGLPSAAASAASKFAAITVDARNGKVLSAENADATRYPASLTKMRTLYILFQDLKAGKIKLDSPIRMSARAAGMAPSKLGVKPGKSITVETAIRALVVKSANDVAAAVAENLGGTEAAFAQRMTRTARAIGMSRSTFANASGLPNPRQVTTARDMATLGLRLMRDFPQYYPYFRSRSFVYGGRTIPGHNRLLGAYEGADGIKTGYINASGFNLVTSARRGDKRLVGVVMGGKTGASRNAYMKKMLDAQFPKASRGKTIAAVAGSAKGAINPVGGEQDGEPKVAGKKKSGKTLFGSRKKDEEKQVAEAAPVETAEEGDNGDETADGPSLYEAETAPQKPATLSQIIQSDMSGGIPGDKAAEGETVASISTPDGAWAVQVGAYASKNDAQARLRQVRDQFPQVLVNVTALTVTVQKDKTITYRARFTGFSESDAKSACGQMAKKKVDCYVLAPAS